MINSIVVSRDQLSCKKTLRRNGMNTIQDKSCSQEPLCILHLLGPRLPDLLPMHPIPVRPGLMDNDADISRGSKMDVGNSNKDRPLHNSLQIKAAMPSS